jgi:hypothetical protein
MHPNRSLFALYSDDHELSIAHARWSDPGSADTRIGGSGSFA